MTTATATQLTPGSDRFEPEFVSVGDFVQTTLVTDTVVYEVVGISASGKTITLRPTRRGEMLKSEDNGSPYPVAYTEALPNPSAQTFSVRRSKRGYFGGGKGGRIGRSLRTAHLIEGKPVRRVDYSF